MITAVFDLDRTLLPGTTAERKFLEHLLRRRIIGVGAAIRTFRYALAVGLSSAAVRIKADRPYLSGVHEATLRLEGLRCFRDDIASQLSQSGLNMVRDHQRAGHHTVLLSGSLPYIVEPLADFLGFDHSICSQPESFRQRLTGRLCGPHPYGEAKAHLIAEYAKQHEMDLSRSYCYADHHTDAPMLELFGFPVCVNPSDRLRQTAAGCGWRVESFS